MRIEVPVLPQTGFTEGSALDLRGRSRHGAPDSEIMGGRYLAPAPQENRDAVRAPQTHSQARSLTLTRPKRRARRVHPRSHRPESSKDGEADPDARINPATRCSRCHYNELLQDFFNRIGPLLTCLAKARMSVLWGIVLQKSFFADDQNSAGRGRDFRVQDARDLTASRKIHRRLR